MILSISGDPMYLIEDTPNQSHQENIDSLCEPSDPNIFFINITIRPLHINISPPTHATAIGFSPHFHNPETTTIYPTSTVDQRFQQRFQQAVTGCQIIADNTNTDIIFLAENGCDISKLLPLL